ncbi:MAG: NAD-dependent malic enzyme [bacterium]|nr:NAD-dependent malic enzyme [bacterium]
MKYRIERKAHGKVVVADVWKRGAALLADTLLNKGTAFSIEERTLFELDGMLPHQPTDRKRQAERAYEMISAARDNPLDEYARMVSLQDRNETLFYQVLSEHVEELLPIVYTPTVGSAAVRFSHVFRRGRGLWITPAHRGRISEILGHARNEEVRLIVVTDNERILGLGDQGAGGMVIPIGKLSLYTLGAGIHPALTLPISLDVGTDNQTLLDDELYVGWRQPRLRGEEYDSLVAEFVDAVRHRFPDALLQWEDFKKANAFRLLDRYRNVLPSFNDDIQGTAAVVAAGVASSGRATKTPIEKQRFLLVGSGAAGVGIARHLGHELAEAGLSPEEVTRAIALTDTAGLVVANRPNLDEHKLPFAWPADMAAETGLEGPAAGDLVQIVERLEPTVIIGTTGEQGVFDEKLVRAMARHVERPFVMALSNPTSKTEAVPEDVINWSDGRALIVTGSPFEPVEHKGRTIRVPQCNNVYIFPAVGLGAIVAQATEVTDSMFAAAANTLAHLLSEDQLAAGMLYPPLSDLRNITRKVAAAVVAAARDAGVGRALDDAAIEAELDREIWDLDYPTLLPI